MRVGPLELSSNLCLAPLAGWTTLALRLVIREIGGLGLATTEVVSARALIGQSGRTLDLLRTDPRDRPLAVQIHASTSEEARDAGLLLEARGFDAIDLNLGCPVRKIAGKGSGASLARDRTAAARVATAVVAAVRIPVTAKMRLGWDAGEITAPELARSLAGAGVSAIAVHGRTRAQGFAGQVDLAGIRGVVEAVPHTPVIGNGDVRSPSCAKRMLDETGCAGVLIGRAAVTDPWIFAKTRALLERGEIPPRPSVEARLEACRRHFAHLCDEVPVFLAARRFRKVLRAWGVALEAGPRFHEAASRIGGASDLDALLDRVRRGDIAVGRPDARDEAVIAVPAGPVDAW